jgi:LPS export ABC transporter protein LptC
MEKKTCIIITALFFLMFLLAGCTVQEEDKMKFKNDEIQTTRVIENFTFVETEEGVKIWEMEAVSAEFNETETGEILEVKDFVIDFYEEDKEKTRLKALYGQYNRDTQVLETSGRVEIETEEKKIITSNVVWDPAKKMFITDEDVTIETEGGKLRGKGMEASVDLESITIKSQIKGEFED